MKHIFLNLKRFDISPARGGVNCLAPMKDWGAAIVRGTQDALKAYDPAEVEFVMYMPEAHLLSAAAALTVLYCIGEKSEEQAAWQDVLGAQLSIGLQGVDMSRVVIAYEPIWSIGPGKTPADKPCIQKIARFVKERTGGLPVVFGSGLKKDNAQMLTSIDEIDGGLIALTRFSGEIGFYQEEYLEIIRTYIGTL